MSPKEEEFAIEIWSMSMEKLAADKWIAGIDVNQIDAFLASGKWDEVSRAALLEERKSAFASYRQGDFDAALLKMIALNRMCLHLGYKQAAHPLLLAATKSRKGASSGGSASARSKKKTAAEWQIKLLPRVGRMLEGGRTDSNIAAILAADAGQSAETVRKFVAGIRKAGVKK
jgi:hypothetical protein